MAIRPRIPSFARHLKKWRGVPVGSNMDSGVKKTTLKLLAAILLKISLSFWHDPRYVARRPFCWSCSAWSIIRLMVGVRTSERRPDTTGGNWKARLFPEPVGWQRNVSFPWSTALIASNCQSLNSVSWKCLTSSPTHWASSISTTKQKQGLSSALLCLPTQIVYDTCICISPCWESIELWDRGRSSSSFSFSASVTTWWLLLFGCLWLRALHASQ